MQVGRGITGHVPRTGRVSCQPIDNWSIKIFCVFKQHGLCIEHAKTICKLVFNDSHFNDSGCTSVRTCVFIYEYSVDVDNIKGFRAVNVPNGCTMERRI